MRISEYIFVVAISFKISLKISVRLSINHFLLACFCFKKNLSFYLIQVIIRGKFLF